MIPVFFEGANSFSFQLTGTIHPRLRTMTLAREFRKLRGRAIPVRIGSPIPYTVLKAYGEPDRTTEYLRSRTFFLSYRPRRSAPLTPVPETEARPVTVLRRGRDQVAIASGVSECERVSLKEPEREGTK